MYNRADHRLQAKLLQMGFESTYKGCFARVGHILMHDSNC